MKNLIFSITIIFTLNIFSQDGNPSHGFELNVENGSTNGRGIWTRVFPISMVFNDYDQYDLHVKNFTNYYHYINGRNAEASGYQFSLSPPPSTNSSKGWDWDGANTNGGAVAAVGVGIYKVEFYWDGQWRDSAIVEWDGDSPGDLTLMFRDDGDNRRIEWRWDPCTTQVPLPLDRRIYSYNKAGCGGPTRNKNFGNFLYSTANSNNYSVLPQDYRQDCGTYENYPLLEENSQWGTGRLLFNLTIDKPVQTRTWLTNGERFEMPTQIVITPNCTLKINSGITFTIKHDPEIWQMPLWYNIFTVQQNAVLELLSNNALLKFENTNWLILDCFSKLIIGSGSNVIMESGSKFCNLGGRISGQGTFTNNGIRPRMKTCPLIPCPDNYFSDSVKFVNEIGAEFIIPDSATYIFEGAETALICKDSSTILFGKGSKLIFRDGARINAKHTKFTTYDSNTTWNGIYLSDVSYDTLQYCVIENALNGINIEDKYSLFTGAPATEIYNCEFSNKTSEQLLNMVYVNNSANVMIRNCTSTSLINDGFASGIIIEYSTAGGVNVIDNEIEYVTTGINVIQSSPYIARNTITGSGTSGTGIYLDNSNGTIEYNIVNNFENSIKLYYSSPYVLKNTFNDGNSSDAYVTAYSAPVMRPIVSGTTLRWLGGNNYFTGQPGTAGIILESEGHPLMDSGYNVVSVGNSMYMQGTISRTLYLRVNNWHDDPPVSQKFDISGESIDYSEYFDGQSLPGTDYYELNEIGFGCYDSVYVKDIGGDNLTAEQIFILAYRKEMERKFVEAVVLYKNVISTYKTSNYAVSSVSRIFNCLEKSNAGINQYSAVKTYYDGLKNSNTYPVQIRELAEDFAIKAKVRMGFIEDAISDYQTIININGNNPKGIHAQINKLVLMNMNSGGDNMLIGNKIQKESYKADLLSLITGKKIQADNKITNNIPQQFKLYQNYPNPFNPKTSIKYGIPQDAQVTLKIYDITGREILSITEYKQAGSYSYTFDGTNYASGLYLYRLEVRQAGSSTGHYVETKKMLLLK